MQLVQVVTKKDEQDFIRVNSLLNGVYPDYIQPLDKDIQEVFDPEKNKALLSAEASRWLLLDKEGQLIGRIAAFVNKMYKNMGDKIPVGGIGFFDCVNDQAAADMLFDVAKHWLMQKGMQAMDGPINLGERDRWWGLVTDGFKQPMYGMSYNPPYYKTLFENYGFRLFFNQICLGMDFKKPLPQKLLTRAEALKKDPAFHAMHIQKNRLDKFAQDFTEVYNLAYAGHGGMKSIKFEQVRGTFRKMKPFMDEKIVWYAYYNEKPIAIYINIPDLNQWFKDLKGKFGILQKLKFLWLMRTRKNPKFTGIVFAVIPEFQAMGVDSFLVVESSATIQYLPYDEYEMQWIGDFNPKMVNMARGLGHVYRSRTLTTYRYLFDRTAEFTRHPVIK
jgi:hypothetical protein